jgi:Zinc finger, C2H2 type/Zinc-finger of C2H2 type
MAAIYICEVCCKPFPSEGEVRQHVHSCINPKRQPRVQLQRLTKEQLLVHKVPLEQFIKNCPTRPQKFPSLGPVPSKVRPEANSSKKFSFSPSKLHSTGGYLNLNTNQMEASKSIKFAGVAIESSAVAPKKKQTNFSLKTSFKFHCDAHACKFSSNFSRRVQMHKARHHNPSKILSCNICGKVFEAVQKLCNHLKRHETSTDGVFKCLSPNCLKTFAECDFMEHFKQHKKIIVRRDKVLEFECEHCGLMQGSETRLKNHINKHFSVMPGQLNCVFGKCKKFFADAADLKKHVARHQKFQPKFSSGFRLKQHQKMKHCVRKDLAVPTNDVLSNKAAAFSCQYCDSTFTTLNHFNLHVENHEMPMPGFLKCLSRGCNKCFSSATALREHSKRHKKTHKCTTCGQFYRNLYGLKIHMKRHSEERTLRCDVPGCSYAGKVRTDIYNHKKYVHYNPGYTCDICGKILKQLRYIRLHMQKHETGTPGVFKCSSKVTKSSTSEREIARSFACQYFGCTKQFESLTSLCIHKRMVHGSQSWSCDLCDQNFRDEQSFADHTIDHPTIAQDPLLLPIECAPPEKVNVKIEELQLF